jgi:uroporphyrin-III C-methyltransferase
MKGKVYLVGAGPGDPELLTVKAVRVLKSADVVLHDALVDESILALVRPHALLVDVGKRAGGKHIAQEGINCMLVDFARSAATVVRLKGGDPMIFGRAAEEMAALRNAGIEFEIVPGITAAVAASAQAQIPLTDRDGPSSVVFLTAQHAIGRGPAEITHLVAAGSTLAIYMPNGRYAEVAKQAIAAGLSPRTPCLIVSNATRPNQELHWVEIAGLQSMSQPTAPALLIIGSVALCRAEMMATASSFYARDKVDFEAVRSEA